MQLKKCLAGLLLLMVSFSTMSQQDKLITHFIYDKMSINPGKTGLGLDNTICATSIYRNQWDKVNGAPNSAVLNIEANLSRILPGGIGLSFYHDAIGFAKQNNLALNYSYPIEIGGVGTLGVGVGVGLINYGLQPDWVPPTSLQDPDLPEEFAATNLDVNFGAYFQGRGWSVGLSSTHLTESLLKQQSANGFEQSYQTARHYYLMGGKDFGSAENEIFGGIIKTNVLMRTDLVKFSADFNALYYSGDVPAYGGLTVRTSDAVAMMFGYTPMAGLTVGYSYDITVNKLASVSRGSHEIFFKFCYNLPEPPKQSARHPRWL